LFAIVVQRWEANFGIKYNLLSLSGTLVIIVFLTHWVSRAHV
jgi:hypothetical protein